MNFPSFPAFSGRLFAGTEDKDLALAVVQAYNDWHIDEWCGAYPGPLHPDGAARAVGPGARAPPRSAGSPRRAATRSPSPRTPPPSATRASTTSTGTRCGRRSSTTSIVLTIHLGSSGQLADHRARRADRRDDHPAADEHLPGGRRPAVVARVQGVPRPSGSRCPRAAPAGSPTSSTASTAPTTCTTRGPVRTSATSCRARSSASTSSPASSPTRSASQLRHDIGIDNICWEMRLPALRLVVAGRRPRSSRPHGAKYGVPDDEIDKITHENAMRWYHFDPFADPSARAVHGRRRCGPRWRATTCRSSRSTRAGSRSPRPTWASCRRGRPPDGARRNSRPRHRWRIGPR